MILRTTPVISGHLRNNSGDLRTTQDNLLEQLRTSQVISGQLRMISGHLRNNSGDLRTTQDDL